MRSEGHGIRTGDPACFTAEDGAVSLGSSNTPVICAVHASRRWSSEVESLAGFLDPRLARANVECAAYEAAYLLQLLEQPPT